MSGNAFSLAFFLRKTATTHVKIYHNFSRVFEIANQLLTRLALYEWQRVLSRLLLVTYQSNRNFNTPLGHLNLWKIFDRIPAPRYRKLFKCLIIGPFQVIKCPYPRQNYQITVLTFHKYNGSVKAIDLYKSYQATLESC